MGRQLFQYHPTVGYHFIPGLKARVQHEGGGYLVRTNEAGFRCDHELVVSKPQGTFRALLFGDSYTAGDGVSNRDRYGDQLERLIPGLQVYNFGLSGTGTDQQLLAYRASAREIEHDLLIIGVLVENVRRVVARYRTYESGHGTSKVMAKPYFTRGPSGELRLEHVPVPKDPIDPDQLPPDQRMHVDTGGGHQWLRRAVNALGSRVKDQAQRLTGYQPLPAYDSPDDSGWLLLKAILLQWASESAKPVLICPIPVYQYVEETASAESYQARFRELHAPPHVTVHDPLPALRRFSPAERRAFRFATDCHLTPPAHLALAESLATAVRPFVERGEVQSPCP